MKPTNDTQRHLLSLAAKLPPLTPRQRKYAYDHCFSPLAVFWPRKREVRCLCCGQSMVYPKPFIDSFVDVDEYDCPYCNRSMPIRQFCNEIQTRERKFFTILTTFRGHQLARTFEVWRCNYTNDHFARYEACEVFQNWILPDGAEVITGRRLHRSAFSMSWDFHLPLDIRSHNASCTGAYQLDDVYDISGNTLYPDVRVTPLVRRNGWSSRLLKFAAGIPLTLAIQYLLSVPVAEMLVKTGQLDLFYNMVRRGCRHLPMLHAVRIANRRKYIVHDAQLWLDMLSMAAELGLDTHNPQIVCPYDLHATHDHILERLTRRRRKALAALRIRQAAQWEDNYRLAKSRFFNIAFGNDTISISVFKTVADIAVEGNIMHHCVYDAKYFRRDDCLLLSARDSAGNRLETIEVSLKTFTVVQSRGRFNKNSPHHDDILSLVNSNMNLIRQAAAS